MTNIIQPVSWILMSFVTRLVIKTFEKSSRPRPWPPGLETKTKTLAIRSQDQDLGHQVLRPRPWPPGLETKTKTLVIRSRDQNLINGHKYLCMCVYMYVCLYEGMCVCYIHNVCMYICIYVCMCLNVCMYICIYVCMYYVCTYVIMYAWVYVCSLLQKGITKDTKLNKLSK